MNCIITRKSRAAEIPELRNIWNDIFGGTGEEAFFRHFYDPELCIIAEAGNSPAAAGYLVPFGEIVHCSEAVPCAMIYSVATRSEYRGLGLGTAVVNGLIDLARELGYPAVVLSPVDDGLFTYYSTRTELTDWFFIQESMIKTASVNSCTTQLEEISIDDYITKREDLLKENVYIKHDFHVLEYQKMLCEESGGGFLRIGDSCAVAERQADGTLWIKELLIPGYAKDEAAPEDITAVIAASISRMFNAAECVVRLPANRGEGRRFGMLAYSGCLFDIKHVGFPAPWYGMAFD